MCGIDGKLYTLFTSSLVVWLSGVDIIHSFASFGFSPVRTGGLLVVMLMVFSLWIVTPFSLG